MLRRVQDKIVMTIGKDCVIHPSVVLDAPIFKLYFVEGKPYRRAIDKVLMTNIGNDVHIGANVSIEAGFERGTIINDHVWIDNNVLIGHDVVLGERVCISGSTIVAGAVTIGDDSFVGVGVTIKPEVTIGKRCFIGAGCVVYKDIPDGMVVRNKMELVMRENKFYPPNSEHIYPKTL